MIYHNTGRNGDNTLYIIKETSWQHSRLCFDLYLLIHRHIKNAKWITGRYCNQRTTIAQNARLNNDIVHHKTRRNDDNTLFINETFLQHKNSLVYHDTFIHAECWMNLWQMSNWGNKGISIAENARRQIYIIHNNTEQWRAQHALYINENWVMHNQKEHILSYPVTGVSGNSRSRSFPRMEASDSLPEFREWIFSIPFPFPNWPFQSRESKGKMGDFKRC